MNKPEAIPAELLAAFGSFVEGAFGLHFPPSRMHDLRRALVGAARDAGIPDPRRYLAALMSQPASNAQIEKLAAHVTIGETYFFRDPASFECIEQNVVPGLVRSQRASRRLRAWSAGCSSGEEAYSLAMSLSRSLAPHAGWQASVVATDINPAALRKARAAIYDNWSFRATPEALKRRFFQARGARFEVHAAITSMVEFAHLNLADHAFPSAGTATDAVDIILCRNVLMYFEPRRAFAVLRKFQQALAPGGCLLLSPVEIPAQIPEGLARVHFPGVIVLRKTADAHDGAPPGPTSPPVGPAAGPPAAARARDSRDPARRVRGDRERHSGTHQPLSGYRQAQLAYERGEYAHALACLEQVAEGQPDHANALALNARIRANQGQLDQAVACCERAIAVDKLCGAWHYLLATLLIAQDRVAEASVSLRRVLFLEPRHALAHFMLGNMARREGAMTEGARHLRNALELASCLPPNELVDAMEGITAGHLAELIETMLQPGDGA